MKFIYYMPDSKGIIHPKGIRVETEEQAQALIKMWDTQKIKWERKC